MIRKDKSISAQVPILSSQAGSTVIQRKIWYQRSWLVNATRVAVAVIIFAGWQLGTMGGVLDPFFFSNPIRILEQIEEWVRTGQIWPHAFSTLYATAIGFGLGTLSGLAAGLLLGRIDFLYEIFSPYLKMLNALPRLLLAPIFLLWFGLGMWSKVALAVTLVFFIIFFNTLTGIRSVPQVYIDNARMLGAGNCVFR